ncbi:MAG: hypothetical protein ACTSX7_06025 [Alphaproteobacteria bacterium]
MVGIRAQLRPSLDEAAELAGDIEGEFAEFFAGYGDSQANFQDLLFAIHTVSHFLERDPKTFSEGASEKAATALVQMIKVYLFFLECLPTIQEQESAVLDLFVEKFGDEDLKDIQNRSPGRPDWSESLK